MVLKAFSISAPQTHSAVHCLTSPVITETLSADSHEMASCQACWSHTQRLAQIEMLLNFKIACNLFDLIHCVFYIS